MKIGLCSYAFRWAIGTRDWRPTRPLTIIGLMDKAKALGVDVVQVDDNLPYQELDEAGLRQLGEEARQRGLILELGGIGLQSDRLRRLIQMCSLCGAHLLRVHEDKKRWQPTVADLIAHLTAVLPDCHRHNVTIALENHFWFGAREVAEIVRAVNDPMVGISLDTGNPVARLEGWREAVQLLAPYAVSLHLKDLATERRGVGFYVAGRPLGKGVIDMAAVLRAVRAAGRAPHVLLELWMDFAQDEATTLRQEEEWAAESVAYARSIIQS